MLYIIGLLLYMNISLINLFCIGKWLPSEEQRLTESVYELCDGQKGKI